MSPSNGSRVLLVAAFALTFLVVSRAQAHGLHVDRGKVTISSDLVEVVIHQTPHRGLIFSPVAELEQLHQALIIRDQHGSRLQVLDTSFSGDQATGSVGYHLRYTITSPTQLLLFQYMPAGGFADRRQIVLAVDGAHQRAARTLRLTSGGNVEYVDLAGADHKGTNTCASYDERDESRFHEVIVEVRRQGAEVVARIHAPLPLLSSFGLLESSDPQWVSAGECQAALPALRRFVNDALTLTQDAQPITVTVASLTFCSPDGSIPDNSPVNIWTTRLQAELRWTAKGPAQIRWNAFNGAVLNVRLVMQQDENCNEQTLSTYAPGASLQ